MPKHKRDKAQSRRALEDAEIAALEARLVPEAPPPGSIAYTVKKFNELPISNLSQLGLTDSGFETMTEIQAASIPHGLAGRDIMGAAKTGSGKTLSFVLPVLEKLWRQRWTEMDGLGALIIAPTRELAVQIFSVLRNVGRHHDLSAGLAIGGSSMTEERDLIGKMAILVGTPGRLLMHMTENPEFDTTHLQMLVLDEADRILDMGFEKDLNSILQNIPRTRQTLLYSATLSKNVRHLARLSLKSPEYIAVHEAHDAATPAKLSQQYAVVELQHKMDAMWSFVCTHRQTKSIVFLATCKQVRYIFELFRRMRPGVSIMMLHSKMKQGRRMAVFDAFVNADKAILFATDIASRGLDFPAVDWVLQADCPDDVDQYIHRAGRTARYESGGHALLFLLPTEEKMVAQLTAKKVSCTKMAINPSRAQTIVPRIRSLLAEEIELKHVGQKAFISYVKMVHLAGNKDVFDVSGLPLAEYAASLGLPGSPQVRFLTKEQQERADAKVALPSLPGSSKAAESSSESESESSEDEKDTKSKSKAKTRLDKLQQRVNRTVLSETWKGLAVDEGDDDDLLVLKSREEPTAENVKVEMRKPKKIKIDATGTKTKGKRTVFDESTGDALDPFEKAAGEASTEPALNMKDLPARMKERDKEDKRREKERKRAEKLKKKLSKKAQEEGSDGEDEGVQLAMGSDEDAGSARSDNDESGDEFEHGDSDGEQAGSGSNSEGQDYSDEEDEEDEEDLPPKKRHHNVQNDEELALALLARKRNK